MTSAMTPDDRAALRQILEDAPPVSLAEIVRAGAEHNARVMGKDRPTKPTTTPREETTLFQ